MGVGDRVDADTRLWGKQDGLTSPYPLLCHMLDTAASARVLWDRWLRPGLRDLVTGALAPGNPDLARDRMMVVAALHDVGKANPLFQGQTRAPRPRPWTETFRAHLAAAGYAPAPHISQPAVFRHEAVSLALLHGGVITGGMDPTKHYLAVATGGHHGVFRDLADNRLTPRELRSVCTGAWADQQTAHTDAVLGGIGLKERPTDPLHGSQAPAALVLISGLLILADWLASEHACVTHGAKLLNDVDPVRDPEEWIARQGAWLADRLPATLGEYTAISDPLGAILGAHASAPSDLQRAAFSKHDGLLLATYPTGDGKTEAALLRHAARTDEGLLFALPTRSTASAMMKRVRVAYSSTANAACLAHGFAALDTFYAPPATRIVSEHAGHGHDDRDTGLHPQDWLSGSKRSLLAPVTVSTCDQVLASALRQAHSTLRLLAVANRHVVLDEVHTYDQYQTRLLTELLAWWGRTGTRVTLLSATLPTWQRNQLVTAYAPGAVTLTTTQSTFPSHTLIAPDGFGAATPVAGTARRTYDLNLAAATTADPVAHHVAWAAGVRATHPHARIAIITNTVGRAQKIAAQLRTAGHQVVALHSRMTAGHREAVSDQLQAWIGRHGTATGLTVVGTQVIEASLDIDVDFMATDLAPAPSLIQRAGRLWRKHDPERRSRLAFPVAAPTLLVHATHSSDGKLDGWGQAPYLLAEQAKTWAVLTATPVLAVPGAVQQFVDDAAYTWADVAAAAAAGSTQDTWAADARSRVARATEVAIPFTGPDGYLADPTYSGLIGLTNRSEVADTETRYVDMVSHTYLLIDATGATPHAWTGTLRQLGTARGPTQLKEGLAATVPASGKTDRALWAAHQATTAGPWRPASAVLRGLLPVDVTAHPELAYDPVGGLVVRPT